MRSNIVEALPSAQRRGLSSGAGCNAPLPLPARGRQDVTMSGDLRSANRKRGKTKQQPPIVVRRLLPLALATLIFAVFLVLDPAAVVGLIWLCLKGSLGAPLQIAALVGLFALLGMTLWVFQLVPSRWIRRRRQPAGNRVRRLRKAAISRKRGKGG
jgi:pilus assembly protein TadC